MTTNLLIAFYSTYGHIHRMALSVSEGAESVPDSTVRLRRIAELKEARKALSGTRAQQAQTDIPVITHDDLRPKVPSFEGVLGHRATFCQLTHAHHMESLQRRMRETDGKSKYDWHDRPGVAINNRPDH